MRVDICSVIDQKARVVPSHEKSGFLIDYLIDAIDLNLVLGRLLYTDRHFRPPVIAPDRAAQDQVTKFL